MTDPTLIFTTFLAPAWYKFSLYMTEYIERSVEIPSILLHDGLLDDFATGDADAGFVDVLSYFQLLKQHPCPIELIAVPGMKDGRKDDIFSALFDIVVRKESALRVSDDLEGCVWAYHAGTSHIEDDFLHQQGVPLLNFGKTLEASSPAQALRYVLDGKADAASIDVRTFDMVVRNSPCMAARLRILGSGCYATYPLLVVASQLDIALKQKVRDAFLNVHRDPFFAHWLHERAIEHFVPATNTCYQDAHPCHGCAQQEPNSLSPNERTVQTPMLAL